MNQGTRGRKRCSGAPGPWAFGSYKIVRITGGHSCSPRIRRGVERFGPPPLKPLGVLWDVETVDVICDKLLKWSGIVRALKPGSPYENRFMAATGLSTTRATTTAGAVAVVRCAVNATCCPHLCSASRLCVVGIA